jgi:hypothetical protein
MSVLVLSPRYSPDSRRLAKAADEAGWDVERLHTWHVPDSLRGRKDIVIYGEHLFGEFLQGRLGIRLVDPPDDLLQAIPEDLRRREVRLARYIDARNESSPKFIKPPNFKNFKAAVYATGKDLPDEPDLATTDVLVSEVVKWDVEFRCFILNGAVVDLSAYARDGNLNATDDLRESWKATPDEVKSALQTAAAVVASGIKLPPAYALDVGQIAGRGWAVVEANAAWGSGIYGCEPAKILPVLQMSVVNPG